MKGIKFIALNISEEGKAKLALQREKDKKRLEQMVEDARNGKYGDITKSL